MDDILIKTVLFAIVFITDIISWRKRKSVCFLFSAIGFLLAIVTELLYYFNLLSNIMRLILSLICIVLLTIGFVKQIKLDTSEISKKIKEIKDKKRIKDKKDKL